MSKPRISVIVPIYNTERFLPRCLDSLLAQTFTDFEILLIDDGSTDGSLSVCRAYAERDNRIRILQTEHIGVGAVRNLGLDSVSGEYLMFCDSDDHVEPEWIEELYRAAVEHPNALCNCEYALSRPSAGEVELQSLPKITKSQTMPKRYYYPLLHYGRVMQIWTRIYRMDVIKEHNLRFRTDLVEGEDAVFNCDYLHCCDSFYYIHKCLYYWVDNDVDSITRSFHAYYFDTLKIIYQARRQHVAPEFMKDFYNYSFSTFMRCLEFVWDRQNTDSDKVKMRYCQRMFRDSVFRETVKNASPKACSRKKRLVILTGSYRLYRILINIKGRINLL